MDYGYLLSDSSYEPVNFDFLDLVQIRGVVGVQPGTMDSNIFQFLRPSGLAISASTISAVSEGKIPSGDISEDVEAFSGSLWEIQNRRITNQNIFLDQVSISFTDKLDNLPKRVDIIEEIKQESVELFISLFIGAMLDKLEIFPVIGPILKELSGFLVAVSIAGYDWLKEHYNEGCQRCDLLKEENNALLTLDPSWENWELRSRHLARNEASIKNMVEYVASLEQRTDFFREGKADDDLLQATEDLLYNEFETIIGDIKVSGRTKLIGPLGETLE